MTSTTLVTKHGGKEERTDFESIETGLVALILDGDGSFLTVNEPEPLQPLLYQKKNGAINIINLHKAPQAINLALMVNPDMKEAIIQSPVLESTTRPYRALKEAFEEIESIINHYSYAKYWLAH